jgi:hypothetical protein
LEETFFVDPSSIRLLDATRLRDLPLRGGGPSFPLEVGATSGIGAAVGAVFSGSVGAVVGGVLGCFVGSAWAIVQHATETVKVFINTPIGGATLGIITKQVVEQVCKTIAKQISESKAKRKINVVLYGPDGNKIDWQ